MCSLCGAGSARSEPAEAAWLAPAVLARLEWANPGWQRSDGTCLACVQQLLLGSLLEHGEIALHQRIQEVWPLDAAATFGALLTPLRMHADPRYTGRDITIALIDSGTWREYGGDVGSQRVWSALSHQTKVLTSPAAHVSATRV